MNHTRRTSGTLAVSSLLTKPPSSEATVANVTDSVEAWAKGAPNYGWVFINTGGNGWDFYTCEFTDIKQRPRLIIEYTTAKSN